MITEEQYIEYYKTLAMLHKGIGHVPGKKDAFFFIPMQYDLSAIDTAIRNSKSVPLLALDAQRGNFDDNSSDSFVQIIEGQFTVIDKAEVGNQATIQQAQNKCLTIGLQLIAKMKQDARKRKLMHEIVQFSVKDVQYDPVGPMQQNHYGYTFLFKLTCPLGLRVEPELWDIDNNGAGPYDLPANL